ncbi:MAG: signal peptide peptidase SppA [Prevotella sp.]|nr:signal peptide peptidase SppA [Bacteroides sp.]MCM1365845.1 signal peptide peptidase SppA [Prevotella sp.]MCM1436463.1 signal peptide peptidase SppA [Prevotella sp.]
MLKKFFLNTLSSFVGTWLAIALCGIAAVIMTLALIGKLASSDQNAEQIKKKSVMVLNLEGEIQETEVLRDFDFNILLSGKIERNQTLSSLVRAIGEAKENSDIEAIYIKCNGASAAPATMHALRLSLLDFKKSGKKIYAYGNSYAQGDYYVASVADSVFLNPQGQVDLHGINGQAMFFKGLFDKLGISFQVFKVGTFKSAVEPYILETMSDPARAQLDTLYGNIWTQMKQEIAASRGFNASNIDTLINRDNISFRRAEFASKSKLVDRIVYERSMDDIFGNLLGKDAEDVNYVSTSLMASQTDLSQFRQSKNQVAVLYATGEIAENVTAGINYENLVPEILELADNDNIKALVLRVNSPGGSVFGTEQIWEALEYFKSKKKPYIVSMGDYAASGGYWISSGADYIFADSMTITGSIGIFGLIPEASGLMNKLGINVVTVGTNPKAVFPNVFAPVDEKQRAAMQKWIEQGYDQFIDRVSIGRKIPQKKVRVIAEGRVWDAVKAKSIGLVDRIGSLQDAVEYAAKKAKLGDKYDVGVYPVVEPGIWDYMQTSDVMSMVKQLKADYPEMDMYTILTVSKILTRSHIQARMPEFKLTM